MPQELKIVYYVEPDAAALAAPRRAIFCRAGRTRRRRPRPRADRHQRRLHAQSGLRAAGRSRAAVARPHAVGEAGPLLGGRALRAARRPRHQLPHDPRSPAGPRAAPTRADSPHGRGAGTGGRRGALRVGVAQSFRLEGAELPRFDVVHWGWVQMDTLRLFFPTLKPSTSWAAWPSPTMSQNKDAWRITLTWPVINRAIAVFFLIGGADKAQILKEVFTGPRDVERLPSQLISPASGILTLLLDSAAASLLPATDAEGCGVLERE